MIGRYLSVGLVAVLGAACRPADQSGTRRDADTTTHGHGPNTAGQQPQPLLPIMQQLGVDMTALTHALMIDDYAAVTQRADALANHAPISEQDLQRIQTVLGSDMPGFEQLDEAVHGASVRLHDAALARDPDAILKQLAEVQSGCVACHTRFRARLKTNQ
ncbi:MAG TPA: cytochrome c [Longimicrobiales bacterium]|nr:cytochrome c [Longimicrobiales bacterium]